MKKESLLDHVYTEDYAIVKNVTFKVPTFGDHLLVITELEFNFDDLTKFIMFYLSISVEKFINIM